MLNQEERVGALSSGLPGAGPAEPVRPQGARIVIPAVDVGLLVVFVLFAALFGRNAWPAVRSLVAHLSLTVIPLFASILFLASARRASTGYRAPWLLFAAASACLGIGHGLWSIRQELLGQWVTFPSLSTYLILGFNPLFAVGAMLALRPARHRELVDEMALDALLVGLVATVLLMRYVISPLRAFPWVGAEQAFWMLTWQLTGLAAAFFAGLLVVWREAVLPPSSAAALVLAAMMNAAGILMVGALVDPDPVHPGHAFTLVWVASLLLLLRAGIGGVQGWEPWTGGLRPLRLPALTRQLVAGAVLLLLGAAAAGLLGNDRQMAFVRIPLMLLALALVVRTLVGMRLTERRIEDARTLAQTKALVEVSNAVSRAQDLDPALELVVDWAQRLLHARGAAICLSGPDQTQFVPAATGDLAPLRGRTLPAGPSLLGWLGGPQDAMPRTLPALSAIPFETGLELPATTPIAAAPLRFGTRMPGVLVVALKERPLYEGELELLGALADQAAVAVENHRLLDEMREGERRRFQAERLSTVGQLAGGIAHEINNPLAAIQSAAELMLEDADASPETRRLLVLIRSEARRAGVIVRNLLELVRPREAQVESVDVEELIEDALQLRAYAHGLQNVAVLKDLGEIGPVRGDPDRLRQVFLNLIVNAEQAQIERPHRRIEIRGGRRGDEIEIRVADNGPGIPPEHLDKLFDPFFTTKGVGQGTGLGLSVTYGILRDLGGSIRAANRHDGGAEFTITLPAADTPPTARPDESPGLAASAGGGEGSVLLVDDEAGIREIGARALRRAGFTVDVAASGEDALELLERRRYDVILSDIKMPGLGGEGLYRRLEEMSIPVLDRFIFISGDIVAEATTSFLAATGRPYLLKPFELRDLVAAVRDVAASRSGD